MADAGRAAIEVGAGVPPAEPWPADIAASEYVIGSLVIRAASVRGVQHRDCAEPRQDAFGIVYDTATQTLLVVVCDGLGSMKYSHEAAAFVCRQLPSAYLTGGWSTAILAISDDLVEYSHGWDTRSAGDPPMATTVVAAAIRCEDDQLQVDLGWCGDSEAWHLAANSTWTPLTSETAPDVSGFGTSGVEAIPSSDPRSFERRVTVNDGALFLMTDGIAKPLAMRDDTKRALADWWAMPPNPYQFARQVAFGQKSFMDDRTAVGIWITRVAAAQPKQVAMESP
jgi:hypothetical protein